MEDIAGRAIDIGFKEETQIKTLKEKIKVAIKGNEYWVKRISDLTDPVRAKAFLNMITINWKNIKKAAKILRKETKKK